MAQDITFELTYNHVMQAWNGDILIIHEHQAKWYCNLKDWLEGDYSGELFNRNSKIQVSS